MKFGSPTPQPDPAHKREPQAVPMMPPPFVNETRVFSRPYPSTFLSTVAEGDQQRCVGMQSTTDNLDDS
jgi:hypothetical protein